MQDKLFPRYFEVEDIPVKVDIDPNTNEMFGLNDLGNPYPPLKANTEGKPITKAEFDQLKQARQKSLA